MEIIKFNGNGNFAPAYTCSKPGDNSGEYIRKEDADRIIVLLKAAHEILKKCDEGLYVKNVLEVTAFYDDTDCDGYCLMEDIAIHLGIDE